MKEIDSMKCFLIHLDGNFLTKCRINKYFFRILISSPLSLIIHCQLLQISIEMLIIFVPASVLMMHGYFCSLNCVLE